MTTIVNVGPLSDLKCGADWVRSLILPGAVTSDVLVKVSPGTLKARTKLLNDCFWIPQFMRNVTIDGSGPEGLTTLLANELLSGMPVVKGMPFFGAMADHGLFVQMGDGLTIRGFEIVGAKTSAGSNNGAGILLREPATDLTVEDCVLRSCQNGIRTHSDDDATTPEDERGNVTMRRTLIDGCGYGGQAHGTYFGPHPLVKVEDSQIVNTISQGNSLKTRGDVNEVTGSLLSTGSGYNSREYDAMGGANKLHNNTLQKLAGYSSQPKNSVHIYIEPQSKDTSLDVQGNIFDMRGKTDIKPIVVDPRVLYNGDGGTGLDGLHHPKGDNYYIDPTGEGGMRPITGIIDNNLVMITALQAKIMGLQGTTGLIRMSFIPNDAAYIKQWGPIPFPKDLVEGPNNRFMVVG